MAVLGLTEAAARRDFTINAIAAFVFAFYVKESGQHVAADLVLAGQRVALVVGRTRDVDVRVAGQQVGVTEVVFGVGRRRPAHAQRQPQPGKDQR